jgi:hypothetical protein
MCKEDETTDVTEETTEVKPKKRGAPQNLIPYTPETAKEASKRAAYCRTLRAQMRKKLLEAAVDAGIDKIYAKALKSGDVNAITVAREGMKLVGLDFASSEESVQRTEAKVDAKNDTKLEVVVKGLNG